MNKHDRMEKMKMDRIRKHDKENDQTKAYISSLQTYNWVYVINTLLRYVGSWFHNSLLNQVIGKQGPGLVFSLVGLVSLQSIITWVERVKSIALFSGLIFSYFLTERRRDVNWTTTWWLTYSGFSFLILILINQGFNRQVLGLQSFVILIGLSDILYGFLMGIRDGQRPRAFAFLARKLTSHSVEASDQVKSLLDNRKISTTIAEMVGMYFFLYLLKEFKINLETDILIWLISICSIANFLCAIYFRYAHRDLDLNDSLMSPEESKNFPREVREWLRSFLNFKGLSLDYIKDFIGRTLSLGKINAGDQGSYKMHLFIGNFIILKCLFCFSKSNFFQIASSCCNYLPVWEKYARSIILLVLLYDLSKSYYRRRTGRHLIKSLDMLGLVTFLTILSKLLVWIGQYTNDARPIVFLAYPFYIFAQGLCVQALNHLFEVWGIKSNADGKDSGKIKKDEVRGDIVTESPALISIKYNALSIGSHVMGKFLNHTLLQVIFSIVSILFNLKLRLIASEAELI